MKLFALPEINTIQTLIFDIDSTLYTNSAYATDQITVQIQAMAKMRNISYKKLQSLIADYRERYAKENNGKSISLGNTLLAFGIPIEQSIAWRRELLEPKQYLSTDVELRKALTVLASRFSLITVTNNPVLPAKKTLMALGVDDLFIDIIGLDTCGVSKPHRLPFETAVNRTTTPCSSCVSIGDRYDIDIALPLEMGMGGILVDGVSDVYRLPDILQ